MTPPLQHCLGIDELSREQILLILEQAKQFVDPKTLAIKPNRSLQDKVICLAFFEPSTRTRLTFELAAKHLGAKTLIFDADNSAVLKGETLTDTVDTLLAMGIDAFVMRIKEEGVPCEVAQFVGNRAHVVNAGDGCREHPTQALLDLLTMQMEKGDLRDLSITICGDIRHSRVARSQYQALKKCGVEDVRLCGPSAFLPEGDVWQGANTFTDMQAGLQGADVVIALRIQKERMQEIDYPNSDQFFQDYGLTQDKLKFAKADAIVMHPGPMNRGVEIAADVADGPQSVILKQVRLGVAARMAVFKLMMAG